MKEASQQPEKDKYSAHPIPEVWRCTLREIANALARGDYELSQGIPFVTPPSKESAARMRAYVVSYGETLAELPDETWRTSVCQWQELYWEVLLDLWTVEGGASDLVLNLSVYEVDNEFRFDIISLHVP